MSHLGWLQARMANTVPAGVTPYRGADGLPAPRSVTRAELAQHATRDSLWLCLRSRVYDCTAYASRHPGGVPTLLKGGGRDCTGLFLAVHPWVNLDLLLGPAFLVGELAEDDAGAAGAVGGTAGGVDSVAWGQLPSVRPLGAAGYTGSALAPAALPGLPCEACHSALASGALVLWRGPVQAGGRVSVRGAWPWGTTSAAEDSQLCVLARGRALLGLPPLLARLQGCPRGTRIVWDMRGIEAQPWTRRAAECLRPLAAAGEAVTLLEGEAPSPAPQWVEGLAAQWLRSGRDPLLQSIKVLPAPHAALIVLALSSEACEAWEKEWEEELRSAYYTADLLLAVNALIE